MPEIHLSIFVIEDGIIYNLADIKRDVLHDGIIEQGLIGCHFTHIDHWDDTGYDEVMPYLRNVGQVFGLEVHCVTFIVMFPITLPVCQYPKNFKVVRGFVEPTISFEVNWLKVIVFIDELHTKVYQNPASRTLFSTWATKLA